MPNLPPNPAAFPHPTPTKHSISYTILHWYTSKHSSFPLLPLYSLPPLTRPAPACKPCAIATLFCSLCYPNPRQPERSLSTFYPDGRGVSFYWQRLFMRCRNAFLLPLFCLRLSVATPIGGITRATAHLLEAHICASSLFIR